MNITVPQLLEEVRRHDRLFLLLDYDGTLVPIAPTPEQARLAPDVIDTLRALAAAESVQLAVISGRSLEDLRRCVPIEGLFLVGGHGAEIRTPTGQRHWLVDPAVIRPIVDRLAARAEVALSGLTGCLVENKRLSLALHYRLAAPSVAREAVARFLRLGEPYVGEGQFQWLRGKRIIELRPAGVHKGRAIAFLLERYLRPGEWPIYLGDDRTDEDAFRALSDTGITIRVSAEEEPSRARHRLRSPAEVHQFLDGLRRHYG
ncbi:MAG: trehalose-phosphatase [Acidobacteria bacterium]|nr:MAG: trehalose-phosphatase [Acidobacteriota bacterium]